MQIMKRKNMLTILSRGEGGLSESVGGVRLSWAASRLAEHEFEHLVGLYGHLFGQFNGVFISN